MLVLNYFTLSPLGGEGILRASVGMVILQRSVLHSH